MVFQAAEGMTLSCHYFLNVALVSFDQPAWTHRTIRSTAQAASGQTDALSGCKWFHVFNQRFHLDCQLLNRTRP
jgi:hypothetical protein